MKDTRTDDDKARDAEKYLKYLAQIRLLFEPMVDNIITYVNHSRRKIVDKEAKKGQKTGIEVYDGSAISAANILTDGIVGYLCSKNLRWFQYTIPSQYNVNGKPLDSFPEVRRWLQDCEDGVYMAFQQSNFYDKATEFVRDGCTIGTSTINIEEDVGRGRIVFTVPHFRETYIAENQFGQVDTNYRVYKMTLAQLVDKFGMDRMKAIDNNFENAYKDNPYGEREIIHAVYPRKVFDPNADNGRNKPVVSLWVNRSPAAVIEENGYNYMPSVTWRWRKNNDEWYGRSPAWDAYIDIILANQKGRTNLVASHKMADPPMVATEDMRGLINTGPSAFTYLRAGELEANMPRPLVQNIQLPYAIDSQQDTRKIISDHFMTDYFLALTRAALETKTELTATQVVEIMGEKAVILGTRVGMFESEGLDPIHDRVFDIEMRAGRIPPAPPILQEYMGAKVEVKYLGPLAQAQLRSSKSRSISAGIQQIAALANINPVALDVIDMDEAARESWTASGGPMTCLRSPKQIEDIRRIRTQQQQQQQMMENLPGIAKAVRLTGQKTEEGSPLAEMTKAAEGAA